MPATEHKSSKCLLTCRYGYLSLDYCERVVENYTLSGIPLETFVTDTPYLDQYQDFTVSSNYPLEQFQAFIQKLHSANQRWVSPPITSLHICHFCQSALL